MQLKETRVAPEGRMLTVEFIGESGELVSVTMDNTENTLDIANAVLRAKAVMVQLATFGVVEESDGSVNRYDALSNGNFDEGSQGLKALPRARTSQVHDVLEEGLEARPEDSFPASDPFRRR